MKKTVNDFMVQTGNVDVSVRFKSNSQSMMQILKDLQTSNHNVHMRGVSSIA